MIGYATIGTNDIDRARAFYDALFAEIGAKRLMQIPGSDFTMYGVAFDKPAVAVTTPYDKGEARPGNGAMIALVMDDRAKVDRLHAKALELGGTCEGPPGLRQPEEFGFYGAYFRDLDGNKFAVFKMG